MQQSLISELEMHPSPGFKSCVDIAAANGIVVSFDIQKDYDDPIMMFSLPAFDNSIPEFSTGAGPFQVGVYNPKFINRYKGHKPASWTRDQPFQYGFTHPECIRAALQGYDEPRADRLGDEHVDPPAMNLQFKPKEPAIPCTWSMLASDAHNAWK